MNRLGIGRRGLAAVAVLLALTGLAAAVFYYIGQPHSLRLAVGPLGSEDARMAAAFVQGLTRDKAPVRLRLVLTEGSEDSAKRIDAGQADLAMLRADIAMPATADTVLITRRSFPFFITRAETAIGRIADLRGRKVGVAQKPAGNTALLKRVLTQYEVRPEEVEIVALNQEEIVPAAKEKRIDVFFAINAVGSHTNNDALRRLRDAWGGDPVLIPIREADALAAHYRAIETGEIVRGALGGDPPRPSESLPTISITSRLVAARRLDDNLIGELTKDILDLRLTLAAELPAVQALETPSTDKDAPLPVHTGAAAYIDGEQESFFDRYGDWFYIGAMALSALGTGGAALLGRESANRRRRAMAGLDELLALLAVIRSCEDEAELMRLGHEADQILTRVLADYATGDLDTAALTAYRLAIDQVGRAVAERQRALAES
ncbi:TAXI family TRAP transporter solute-binding subunit [Bosea sp. (in: a-proteobacteria)]|uniref:TAXI family TRAP transporter solute-binding subunit n=1 Tax=Bosea sp. (in: a-proteobacteria) TaxID=1871050 RepID=UPI002633BD73|nr:TAXI family TRAP transporter solute-binding subunit [Bosea sp. (in: a-proteobacteria)]MCO5090316.1 ABC transporter substrate-binding protein [Bosea sp. (in: a-proteobacteria)]